jgi:hypothetical protein
MYPYSTRQSSTEFSLPDITMNSDVKDFIIKTEFIKMEPADENVLAIELPLAIEETK